MKRAGVALALAGMLLAGCATTLNDVRGGPGAKLDPWENWNRKVFSFNEALDEKVPAGRDGLLQPRARAGAARRRQLFGNFADAWSAINNFLQGKGTAGVYDIMRVGTNTVFGLGGVLDVATEAGLEKTRRISARRWASGHGHRRAYIVWPFFGPSSVRDSIGLPMDIAASPATVINDGATRYSLTALNAVNTRANLLGATRARRHRAGQVHLRPRCLPAAPPQPGVRRQRAAAGRSHRGRSPATGIGAAVNRNRCPETLGTPWQ